MDKQEGGDAGLESGRDIYQNSRPLGQSGVREQHAEATEATLASLADQGVSSVVSASSNKSLEKEEERKSGKHAAASTGAAETPEGGGREEGFCAAPVGGPHLQ